MIRTHGILVSLALVAATACHLYFEDEPENSGPELDAGVDPSCPTVDETNASLRQCFTFEEWEAQGLCDIPTMRTQQGTCANCHASGGDGIQLNRDCMLTFTGMMAVNENFEDLTAALLADETGCVTGYDVGKICSSALISENHPAVVCPNNLRDGVAGVPPEQL